GTSSVSPVWGLRACRGLRFLTSKTPKSRSSRRPSFTNASTIPSKTRCTMALAWSWVMPNSWAIALAMSLLVTTYLPPQARPRLHLCQKPLVCRGSVRPLPTQALTGFGPHRQGAFPPPAPEVGGNSLPPPSLFEPACRPCYSVLRGSLSSPPPPVKTE